MAVKNRSSDNKLLREIGIMLLFNTVIALYATMLSEESFGFNLVLAQSIGLSMYSTAILIQRAFNLNFLTLWPSIAAIPIGLVFGVCIANIVLDIDLLETVHQHPGLFTSMAVVPPLFGTIIGYYFYTQAHITKTRQSLEAETMNRAIQERDLAEFRLKLLQGQIEPHFLFNVHSNILALIRSEPQEAEKMLAALTQYLHGSLRDLRESRVTLREEMALLESYLAIQSIRMGERLSYQIWLPDSLADQLIPPLLLQPLVENSIIHGLEPSVNGGKIHVSAQKRDNHLLLEIRDNGLGFQEAGVVSKGLGLENVQCRIHSGYNGMGRLEIRESSPSGVHISIHLPLGRNYSKRREKARSLSG